MASWSDRSQVSVVAVTSALSAQVLPPRNALAHDGHTQTAQPSAPLGTESLNGPAPTPIIENIVITPDPASAHYAIRSLFHLHAKMHGQNSSYPVGFHGMPAPPASPSLSLAGAKVGLGESVLGLLITGPFLLMALRKQFQS
ncbi:MAG: hypothetical protein O2890_01910 [Cyanobacteria bacterium]|nr:hypothetical protein [Cyanobacteriota bacterium]MDA0865174.1 hypothetical protein [Cyanobacteriota bacterium]